MEENVQTLKDIIQQYESGLITWNEFVIFVDNWVIDQPEVEGGG
jgi:hypothetical protein